METVLLDETKIYVIILLIGLFKIINGSDHYPSKDMAKHTFI